MEICQHVHLQLSEVLTSQQIQVLSVSHTHTHTLQQKQGCLQLSFGLAALWFPFNHIVTLLASDLWQFQHSSHLLVCHFAWQLPSSTTPNKAVGDSTMLYYSLERWKERRQKRADFQTTFNVIKLHKIHKLPKGHQQSFLIHRVSIHACSNSNFTSGHQASCKKSLEN